MAARVEAATMGGGEIDEESDERGSMWDLDQKLDQSMDEEAGRLRNMYKEKVYFYYFYHPNLIIITTTISTQKNLVSKLDLVNAEILGSSASAAFVSEPRCCVWRSRDFSSLCFLQYIPSWDQRS